MPHLQLVSALPGHTGPAWCVAFNPARPLLASCGTDKTVRLFSYTLATETDVASTSTSFPSESSPQPRFTLAHVIPTEHRRTVRALAWAPGGRTLATASFDSTVAVWEEVEDDEGQGEGEWECVTTLEGHENECKGVAFSADGGLLASCSRDRSVWVWEVQPDADFECIAVMMDHAADVKTVAWHPKEELLASASYDAHIHLSYDDPDADWALYQRLVPTLPAADLHIPESSPLYTSLAPALSPSAAEVAGAGLPVPPLTEPETVWSLAWSPCGRFLASGGDQGGIRLWARTGTGTAEVLERVHSSAHKGPCYALAWAPARALARGGTSGGAEGAEIGESGDDTETGSDAGLLVSAGADGRIIIWQITAAGTGEDTTASLSPIAAVRDAHGVADVNGLAWNVREDARGMGILASAGDDGSVHVWRVVQ